MIENISIITSKIRRHKNPRPPKNTINEYIILYTLQQQPNSYSSHDASAATHIKPPSSDTVATRNQQKTSLPSKRNPCKKKKKTLARRLELELNTHRCLITKLGQRARGHMTQGQKSAARERRFTRKTNLSALALRRPTRSCVCRSAHHSKQAKRRAPLTELPASPDNPRKHRKIASAMKNSDAHSPRSKRRQVDHEYLYPTCSTTNDHMTV